MRGKGWGAAEKGEQEARAGHESGGGQATQGNFPPSSGQGLFSMNAALAPPACFGGAYDDRPGRGGPAWGDPRQVGYGSFPPGSRFTLRPWRPVAHRPSG